jgi:hypothetical protein
LIQIKQKLWRPGGGLAGSKDIVLAGLAQQVQGQRAQLGKHTPGSLQMPAGIFANRDIAQRVFSTFQ